MNRMIRLLPAALAALLFLAAPAFARDARADVDALLAADRAFSAAAANAPDIAGALAAMFDEEVVVPIPGSGLVVGRDAVLAAFRAGPALREGLVSWAPVRGGISADGSQGFTFGFLALTGGDPARRARKYLAYWVRRPQGWRVVAYRQVPREPGEVSTALLPPSLPGFSARPGRDRRTIEAHRSSLHAAERAFSDRAQSVGLRAAFREYGREDAMNMYAGAGFAIGRDAIAANFPEGERTSPVSWRTERSFVASSGDLGVSIGTIRANAPAAGGRPAAFPFFTVWRRDGPRAPWRYIAE
jgi:ketosteroid isomerase-like protein